MFYRWKQILHFFTSNSRHGTHSPFVYELAEKVIYAKQKNAEGNTPTKHTVKHRLIADIAAFYTLQLQHTITEPSMDKACYIPIDKTSAEAVEELQHRFFMVFLDDIHRNTANEAVWDAICRSDAVLVSIDMFHFGIVCYRPGQRKENFKLRFPFWRH